MGSKTLLCLVCFVFALTVTYSQPILPDLPLKMESGIFEHSLTFSFQSTTTAWSDIELFNIQGESLFSIKIEAIKGNNDVKIDGLDKLACGLYVLHVQVDKGQRAVKRIQKIHTN